MACSSRLRHHCAGEDVGSPRTHRPPAGEVVGKPPVRLASRPDPQWGRPRIKAPDQGRFSFRARVGAGEMRKRLPGETRLGQMPLGESARTTASSPSSVRIRARARLAAARSRRAAFRKSRTCSCVAGAPWAVRPISPTDAGRGVPSSLSRRRSRINVSSNVASAGRIRSVRSPCRSRRKRISSSRRASPCAANLARSGWRCS